jgi:hypothetical protein
MKNNLRNLALAALAALLLAGAANVLHQSTPTIAAEFNGPVCLPPLCPLPPVQ